MRTSSLISSAVQNSFRSKTRTLLTVLAVFIGAFTLTVTNGLGTGVGRFIDDTVAAIGADGVLTASKTSETAPAGFGDEPLEYDPDVVDTTVPGAPDGAPGATTGVVAMTPDTSPSRISMMRADRNRRAHPASPRSRYRSPSSNRSASPTPTAQSARSSPSR